MSPISRNRKWYTLKGRLLSLKQMFNAFIGWQKFNAWMWVIREPVVQMLWFYPSARKMWVLVKSYTQRKPILANNKIHHVEHSGEDTSKRNCGLTVSKGQSHMIEHHQQRHEENNWNSCCGYLPLKTDDTCQEGVKQTTLSHFLLWSFLLKKIPLTFFVKSLYWWWTP